MSEKRYVRCNYVKRFEKGLLTENKIYEVDYIDSDGDIHITRDDEGDEYFIYGVQGTLVDEKGNPL